MKTIGQIENSIRHLNVEPTVQMHNRVLAELLDLMEESTRRPSGTGRQDRWRAVYRSNRFRFAAAAAVILSAGLIGYHIFQTIRPSPPAKPISDAPDNKTELIARDIPDHRSSENMMWHGTKDLTEGRGFRQLRAVASTVVHARIIRISGIVSEDAPGDTRWDVDVIKVLDGRLSENRAESKNRIGVQVPYPLSLSVSNIGTGTEVILFLGIGNEGQYELISVQVPIVEGEDSISDRDNSQDKKAKRDNSSGEEE
ncbi:MAG: hypothetical protein GWN67_26845 [Phycisphaerae bacterium]|nr:hypothetical protein [Phycisphaerae bacterium]NIU59855.1 hypothetical protein [Phycisphaerae bacterium]